MSATLQARLAWEHTHRELLPALLLLHALAERGRPWSLEHVRELDSRRSPDGPAALLLPYYYDPLDNDLFLARERDRLLGSVVVNMAWEQMHFRCGRGYLLPDGPFAQREMVHLAWGPRFASLLQEHGVPQERIFVTGHLRLDLYHHRQLLQTRADLAQLHALRADVPWVLVPLNFNLAYVKPRSIETLRARRYALTDEFIDGVRTARDAFVGMCRAAALACPEREIIVRVHPAGFEAEEFYKTGSLPANLHFISAWDIASWICAAETVVVWNSTSAIEAMVAGTRVVCFEPEPFAERFDYDVPRIVPRVTTQDEVIDVLRQGDRPLGPLDWQRFSTWYAHHDGNNHQRVADVIDRVAADLPRYAVQTPMPLGRRGWWRRLKERVAAPKSTSTSTAPSTPHRLAVEPAQLERAVSTLSASPLGDLLR